MGNALNPGHIGLACNPTPPDCGDRTEWIEQRSEELLDHPGAVLEFIQQSTDLQRELDISNSSLVGVMRVVGEGSPCTCRGAKAVLEVFKRAAEKMAELELDASQHCPRRPTGTEYINGGFA